MNAPITRRIEGIKRDSRAPQRIAYPIITPPRKRCPKLTFIGWYFVLGSLGFVAAAAYHLSR